jgi:aldehyde:ferredoxin oxidoreductase
MEFRGYTLTDMVKTINACTGFDWSTDDLRDCNIRYGWKTEDDFNYPKRFMEPVDEGPAAGKIPVGLEDAIVDYYKERGWDEKGMPTTAKLKEMGMEDFVD